jgi:hypothetical protein
MQLCPRVSSLTETVIESSQCYRRESIPAHAIQLMDVQKKSSTTVVNVLYTSDFMGK